MIFESYETTWCRCSGADLPCWPWSTGVLRPPKRKMRVESGRAKNSQPREHGFDENLKMPRTYWMELHLQLCRNSVLRPSLKTSQIRDRHLRTRHAVVPEVKKFSNLWLVIRTKVGLCYRVVWLHYTVDYLGIPISVKNGLSEP